jgi:hypothetical protein
MTTGKNEMSISSHKERQNFLTSAQREMFVPLRHDPGHAQVDFGEALAVIGGVERKIHFFAMDLPHSDSCLVQGLHSPRQVCLAERAQYAEFANLTPFRALGKLFFQGLKPGPCLIHGRVAVLELLFCPVQLDKQVRGRLQIVDFVAQLAYLCINGSYLRSPLP